MIRGVLLSFFLGRLIAGVCVLGVLGQLPWLWPKEADATQPFVLDPESFRHYVDRFNDEDEELYTNAFPNSAAWEFLKPNIPLFERPDEEISSVPRLKGWK